MEQETKQNSKKDKVSLYFSETKVLEVILFNGQIVVVHTGIKPIAKEQFGVKWLRLQDDDKIILDIRVDTIAYIRNYPAKYYEHLLSYGKDKGDGKNEGDGRNE